MTRQQTPTPSPWLQWLALAVGIAALIVSGLPLLAETEALSAAFGHQLAIFAALVAILAGYFLKIPGWPFAEKLARTLGTALLVSAVFWFGAALRAQPWETIGKVLAVAAGLLLIAITLSEVRAEQQANSCTQNLTG